MARNSRHSGRSQTNPNGFAKGETVSQALTATMITEVRISGELTRLSINGILFYKIYNSHRSSRLASQRPGNIGSHTVKPRNSKVAVSAASTGIPSALSMPVELVSKMPRPSGIGLSVATIEETTKMGNVTRNETSCPIASNMIHSVAASSRKIATYNNIAVATKGRFRSR
jgi:hypothetical protein